MHQGLVKSKINSRTFESDLKSIIQRCEKVFNRLSGEKILITGATGFIGTWLTHTFLMANKELGCKIEIDIVYRDELKLNEIYFSNLSKIRNKFKFDLDIESSFLPFENKSYGLLIHAASNTNYHSNQGTSTSTYNLLKMAKKQKNSPIFIYISSGAVYGELNVQKFSEISLHSMPVPSKTYKNYVLEKYLSEKLIEEATRSGEIYGSCPRLFSFYGPFFPIKNQYAVSSFLMAGLSNKKIELKGSPATTRSYLYPTDLITAILKQTLSPSLSPTHIGSDKPITMIELATMIDNITGNNGIEIYPSVQIANHYVPEILKTESRIGTIQTIEIANGLERWRNLLAN